MIHPYKGIQPVIAKTAFIADQTTIIGDVVIGDKVGIWFGTVIRGDVNRIRIGHGSNIQDNSTVHVSTFADTNIGCNVTVGHNCIIHGCDIGDTCLIGMGATILDGAVIGANCLVGAESLVTMNKVFPEGMLIMGSPAKAIRPLTEEELASLQSSADHYMAYAAEYRQQMAH